MYQIFCFYLYMYEAVDLIKNEEFMTRISFLIIL